MNSPEESTPARTSFLSAEAMVGIGITIAMSGLLFVMLGWAQHMRQVKEAAWILLPLGGVLIVLGVFAAAAGRIRRPRP